MSVSQFIRFHLQIQNSAALKSERKRYLMHIYDLIYELIYDDVSKRNLKPTSDEKILMIRKLLLSKFFDFESGH